MKRVLIITYYWPPSGGSGVQRWVKFAKYLPQNGWQPVIYTPENPEFSLIDRTLEDDIPEEAVILKRPILEPYGIYRRLSGKGGAVSREAAGQVETVAADFPEDGTATAQGGWPGVHTEDETANAPKKMAASPENGAYVSPKALTATGTEVNPINAQKKSLGQKISLWIRGNLFIPDPRCLWVRPSVKFLKKYLEEHPVDIIVSTGPPHSMHLIARRLARETGLPWVADFRDPWTRMFYFKHLPLTRMALRRNKRLEQKVLDDASAVVAVSPLVQDEFRQMTSTPVTLITNGFDEEDFETADTEMRVLEEETGSENEDLFNIVHTGLFAADGNPLELWKVLSEIAQSDGEFASRLRIRLSGKTDRQILDSISEAGLGKNLVNLGYVSHDEAVREQCGASALILPLRREPEYRATLPGKLFEYLASRRPVIGIGQTDGAMARLLTDAHAGATFDWDDAGGLKKEVLRCWSLSREGRLLDNDADIGRYSRKRLTREMAGLFDSLL